jgi:hypothetical protein
MKRTDPPSRDTTAAGHHHYTPEELHNEDVAHEHSDVNIARISVYAVGLAAVMVISFALMYGLFWFMEDQAAANDPQLSPLAPASAQMPRTTTGTPTFGNAPGPRLLTNEYAALAAHRASETQQLTSYGWVNERGGIARMPIAEAKKLVAERGLPSRAGGTADMTLGTFRPSRGEASSGRAVDGAPRGAGLPDVGGAAPAPQHQAPTAPKPPQKDGH